jgi:hypothetical protein
LQAGLVRRLSDAGNQAPACGFARFAVYRVSEVQAKRQSRLKEQDSGFFLPDGKVEHICWKLWDYCDWLAQYKGIFGILFGIFLIQSFRPFKL